MHPPGVEWWSTISFSDEVVDYEKSSFLGENINLISIQMRTLLYQLSAGEGARMLWPWENT